MFKNRTGQETLKEDVFQVFDNEKIRDLNKRIELLEKVLKEIHEISSWDTWAEGEFNLSCRLEEIQDLAEKVLNLDNKNYNVNNS